MIRFNWGISNALLLILVSTSSYAGLGGGAGTGVGNGGTVIQLPDGTVVMSDPFVVPNSDPYQKFSNLNLTIQTELAIIDKLLVRYGAIPDQSAIPDDDFSKDATTDFKKAASAARILQETNSRTAQSDFLMNHVVIDQVQYHFDDVLPDACIQNEEVLQLPPNTNGAITEMAGCTIANETHIRRDLYAKMDNRNQTMLLLHERLHALLPTDHQNIINITTGAFVALDLYQQQSLVLQNKPNAQFSDFVPPTAVQLQALQNMVTSIASMNYLHDGTPVDPDGSHWKVSPNGGGIYFSNSTPDPNAIVNENATISNTAFIGIGSVLGKFGSAGDDTIMINSACYTSACTIGNGASMIESSASAIDENAERFSVNLDATAQMKNSQISVNSPDSSAVVHLAPSASMNNSVIQGIHGLELEAAASIENSMLFFNSNDGSSTKFGLGAGSDTNGMKFSITSQDSPKVNSYVVSVPANEKLALNMTNPFQCQSGYTSVLSSDLSITSLNSISALCAPIQKPLPSN